MSSTSRVRKSSPVKQGPMRATIPMSSLMRQNTGFRKSPTLSPTSWRCRTSPDNASTSSGQRSPGSVTYKGLGFYLVAAKSKSDSSKGNIIRRTASLDTIYLKGQWPRDNFYFHSGLLQVDKATQTEDQSSAGLKFRSMSEDSPSSSCLNDEICLHRRQRLTSSKAVNIPQIKPMIKPPMRSSIEGLNQEIEKLVLNQTKSNNKIRIPLLSTSNNSMEREDFELDLQLNLEQMTPEGHRAPLADLLRSTRSVNTQTPAGQSLEELNKSASASASSSSSPEDDDQLCCSSSSSSRFFSTSPHINRFLAREPPDGCERVNLRFYEDTGPGTEQATLLNPPNVTFQLKPSLGSAFQPLKTHHHTNNTDSPG